MIIIEIILKLTTKVLNCCCLSNLAMKFGCLGMYLISVPIPSPFFHTYYCLYTLQIILFLLRSLSNIPQTCDLCFLDCGLALELPKTSSSCACTLGSTSLSISLLINRGSEVEEGKRIFILPILLY